MAGERAEVARAEKRRKLDARILARLLRQDPLQMIVMMIDEMNNYN